MELDDDECIDQFGNWYPEHDFRDELVACSRCDAQAEA